MSTVKSTTMQCDELTAKSGTGIPNTLVPLTADAYAYFTGKDTVGIVKGLNCSSVIDEGNANYKVSFITPMVDADYTVVVTTNAYNISVSGLLASSFNVATFDSAGNPFPRESLYFLVFGGQS